MGDLPAIIVTEIRRLLIDFSPKAFVGAAVAVRVAIIKEAPDYYIATAFFTWFLVFADSLLALALAVRDNKLTWSMWAAPIYKLTVYTILSLAWLGLGLGAQLSAGAAFAAGTALNTYFLAHEFLSILNHSDALTGGNLKVIVALRNVANAVQDKSQQVVQAVTDVFSPKDKNSKKTKAPVNPVENPED